MQRPGGSVAGAVRGTAGGRRIIPVPPILDCLREDGSLYAELRGDAALTASAFLRKKNQVLGKRPVSEDTTTEDGTESFVLKFRGDNEKRSRGADASSHEVQHIQQEDGGAEEEEEATSPGAAGQLTGADDRACQEP
jgi:hypothetical protein